MTPHPAPSPGDLGRIGLACLDQYELDGDEGALSAGLVRLEQAVAAAPGHPDRMRWWYGLGSGYESRAEELGSVEDYDRAIGWYCRLYADLPPDDPDATFIMLVLTGAYWGRFWLCRYGGPGEPEGRVALADEVVTALRRWPIGLEDVEAAAYVHMIRGLGHHERYDATGEPADLDASIGLLAAALPALPPDTPWVAVATFALATGYRDRYGTGREPAMLDLAIETGTGAIELSGDEEPTWLSANEHQALCYAERWRLTGNPADLDRAIAAWRVVRSREDDGWSAARNGELLRRRAVLTGDPVDAAEAVRLLARAVRECAEGPGAAEHWLELGRAHRTQWTVNRTVASLDAAEGCVGAALDLDLTGDDLLSAHHERLEVARQMVLAEFLRPAGPAQVPAHESSPPAREGGRPGRTAPPSAGFYREALADGRAALARCGDGVDPDLFAMVAAALGLGEMWICRYDLGTFDAERVRRLLALAARKPDAGDR
jgi:hypothetical protein